MTDQRFNPETEPSLRQPMTELELLHEDPFDAHNRVVATAGEMSAALRETLPVNIRELAAKIRAARTQMDQIPSIRGRHGNQPVPDAITMFDLAARSLESAAQDIESATRLIEQGPPPAEPLS